MEFNFSPMTFDNTITLVENLKILNSGNACCYSAMQNLDLLASYVKELRLEGRKL